MADQLDHFSIVKPLIEAKRPDVMVTSWIPSVSYREFPLVNLRSLGGSRNGKYPHLLRIPIVEITAYSDTEYRDADELYDDVLDALYDAQLYQTMTPGGYIHSIKETMGKTSFDSPFDATWRVQGLVKLGIRPPNGG